MKTIKKINNNVAICVDQKGRELVAFGRGIGFQVPGEITDLSIITQTFYGIDENYLALLEEVDSKLFEICIQIMNYAERTLQYPSINRNMAFTLADHLSFAIKRQEEGIEVKLPIYQDIKYLYEKETKVGEYGWNLIRKKMQIELPETEIYAIALHIVNSIEFIETEELRINNQTVVDCVTAIIEDSLKTKIDRENINYARFVTHLCYLLKRIESEQNIISENSHLLSYLIKEYPEVYKTILTICDFFKNTFEYNLNDDEIVYLLIHVNRLYSRQDFK